MILYFLYIVFKNCSYCLLITVKQSHIMSENSMRNFMIYTISIDLCPKYIGLYRIYFVQKQCRPT